MSDQKMLGPESFEQSFFCCYMLNWNGIEVEELTVNKLW